MYSVAKLNGSVLQRVHAICLFQSRFALQCKDVTPEILELADHTTARFETVDVLTDIAEDSDQSPMMKVCWDGFPDERDCTWHRIEVISRDVPNMLLSFLTKTKLGPKHFFVKSAQRLLNAS